MDTDSSDLALSAPSFEELVKPHLRAEYLAARLGHCKDGPPSALHFFPRSCCEKHSRYDKRVLGLLKTEYVGGIRSLANVILLITQRRKLSNSAARELSKGWQTALCRFLEACSKTKNKKNCENKGIRLKGNSLYTYKQTKLSFIGFNYLYVKSCCCFGFNGPLRQFFSLHQAVSQREGEIGKKG